MRTKCLEYLSTSRSMRVLEGGREKVKAAVEQLRRSYRSAPTPLPRGAQGEFFTYLHLIVNSLELSALEELLGKERAGNVLEYSTRTHYTWIYRRVLDDGD